MSEKINIEKVVAYWRKSAQLNFETAEFLFRGKKYCDCLFFCHLTLEKTLKGLTVQKTKTHAPYSHILLDLAKKTGIELKSQQIKDLSVISTFNIAGRYDDQKFKFYQKCTPLFSKKYFQISQKLYTWLQENYQN